MILAAKRRLINHLRRQAHTIKLSAPSWSQDREVKVPNHKLDPDKDPEELSRLQQQVELEQLVLDDSVDSAKQRLTVWIKIYIVALQVSLGFGGFYNMHDHIFRK